MKIKSLFLVLFTLLLSGSALFPQGSNNDPKKAMEALTRLSDSFEALSAYVSPSVVQVFSLGYGPGDASTASSIIAPRRNSGSGVILDASGYIVTNNHVVEGATHVEVLLPVSRLGRESSRSILKPAGEKVVATIVGTDVETDIAVLKIERNNLPKLPLGDSDQLRSGQVVMAFGSPLGLENSVSMGIVSSVARQFRPEDPVVYIQTDAPINPGNSGGPLVDTEGRVVGINTLILSQSGGSEGLGFAVPANIVRNVYQQILKDGRVRRGYIGVKAQTVTQPMAKVMNLSQDYGVILSDVYPGSPASLAGLKPGDVIFAIGSKLMENGRQFNVNLYQKTVGEKVLLEVLRGSERLKVEVEVIERDDDPGRFSAMVNGTDNLVPRLGVLAIDINRRVEEMLPNLRKRFGVLVAAISAETPSEDVQFYPGDVIYSINNTEVTSLKNLQAEMAKINAGDPVVIQIQRGRQLQYLSFFIEK